MMNATVTFDNKDLFGTGKHMVQPLSWRRETIERGFAGLDGVLSIDLGRRERKIKQYGVLTSTSVTSLIRLITIISDYIDGQSYDLTDQNGVLYPNVRMDSFTLLGPIAAANQARCEYEIIYTQLSA